MPNTGEKKEGGGLSKCLLSAAWKEGQTDAVYGLQSEQYFKK